MLKGIVFDFDDTIVDTVDMKADAFRKLFPEYPDHHRAIERIHRENSGMTRFDKFRSIYRDVLDQPLSDERIRALDQALEALVRRGSETCQFVPGAKEFIERRAAQYPLFVVSNTPETELQSLMASRGLTQKFRHLYGWPRTKHASLASILAELGAAPPELLMIGDSAQDYVAAAELNLPFVGRVPAGHIAPFPGPVLATVADLTELESRWPMIVDALG